MAISRGQSRWRFATGRLQIVNSQSVGRQVSKGGANLRDRRLAWSSATTKDYHARVSLRSTRRRCAGFSAREPARYPPSTRTEITHQRATGCRFDRRGEDAGAVSYPVGLSPLRFREARQADVGLVTAVPSGTTRWRPRPPTRRRPERWFSIHRPRSAFPIHRPRSSFPIHANVTAAVAMV